MNVAQTHSSVRLLDTRREEFDRLLMQQIADRRMPVFGIGAGMQLLNVSQGGNLFLHIPEDMPKSLPHKDPLDAAHRHFLDKDYGKAEGLFAKIIKQKNLPVNVAEEALNDLDERGMTGLALTAVDASFASPETKAAVRAEISSYAATPAP